MAERERLTKHWGNNCVATKLNYDFLLSLPNIEVKNFNAIIQKLAHYEDLEEQGKIIVLPCKVGDTIYEVYEECVCTLGHINKHSTCTSAIECGKCRAVKIERQIREDSFSLIMLKRVGVDFFITREEAEKALKEREANG